MWWKNRWLLFGGRKSKSSQNTGEGRSHFWGLYTKKPGTDKKPLKGNIVSPTRYWFITSPKGDAVVGFLAPLTATPQEILRLPPGADLGCPCFIYKSQWDCSQTDMTAGCLSPLAHKHLDLFHQKHDQLTFCCFCFFRVGALEGRVSQGDVILLTLV